MKQIIFDAIYHMLLTKQSPLTFSSEVISNLIEQLNIYGTSIDKFRRILKLIIIEFVYQNKHIHVHKAADLKALIYTHKDDEDDSRVNQMCMNMKKKLKKVKDGKIELYNDQEIDEVIIP